MSDVQATTPSEGAAVSTDPRFDSFFSSHSVEEPLRDDAAAGGGAQGAQGDEGAGDDDSSFDRAASRQPDASQQPENGPKYASFSELLAAHKVDPAVDWQSLPVTVKIDGRESQVALSDVLKSYQLEGHVNNKSIELSNLRNTFEQERNQWNAAVQQELGRHRTMAGVALQMLNHDFQKVDWNALRVQNPAEFAALQAEYGQRQQQIQGFLANVQQQQQQVDAQQQQAMQQSLAGENEKLMNARPEWRNDKAFEKDREDMTKYARSIGFNDAEIGRIFDHRYMLILHDAARYRALQAASPEVLNKVRQAPPMAAPGSRTDVNPKEAARQKVLSRLNRNPRDEDAQAAAFDFFANQ